MTVVVGESLEFRGHTQQGRRSVRRRCEGRGEVGSPERIYDGGILRGCPEGRVEGRFFQWTKTGTGSDLPFEVPPDPYDR